MFFSSPKKALKWSEYSIHLSAVDKSPHSAKGQDLQILVGKFDVDFNADCREKQRGNSCLLPGTIAK